MKRIFLSTLLAAIFFIRPSAAQILVSAGTNYAQSFNSLAASGTVNWTNNVTLPGWYAAKGPTNPATYLAGAGTATSGSIYSFGTNGANPASDRALGSVAASSLNYAFGVRFTNDTVFTVSNITVSFAGEQWRCANVITNTLTFSYQVSSSPLTNADANNAQTWTDFSALTFNSPNTNGGSALDGNLATNRQVFTAVLLNSASVGPGQEFFLRWRDVDDTGSDAGLAVDDLTVTFSTNTFVAAAPPELPATNTSITLMTYNVKGNGVTDWSTNTVQVQAIGRQLLYLKPDVITFNEIPRTNVWQMANWVIAFMPGYFIATNSGNDGFINCVIASRYPINRSKSWLDGANLNPFGYTNTSSSAADNYTRDLFEAEINVPNWSLPLHVFTTHLKSSASGYADAAAKRAAEAAAVTNFFATNFFVLYPTHPFTLSGDMNEADTNTLALQRLLSAPTTLRLQNPTNPFSGSINTYSSDSPGSRIDYIFPCAMLASNLTARQVFRTDTLTPTPTNLLKYDSTNASDHLPVLMTFANPFNTPYKFTTFTRTNQSVTLKWESATNRLFSLETSSNLSQWTVLATNLFATGTNFTFATNNVSEQFKFFRLYRVP
jgi:endonuclease/exonuclease/phosphatase family metal-dependent hydrolase